MHFHQACKNALTPFGADLHAKYKKWWDEYFYIKHRNEPRGIGGTIFGLQTNGCAESILLSMPPLVKWRYDWHPEKGTAEAKLYEEFLVPKDWV